MGVDERTDEREFLETLSKRSGDTIFQSTIKSNRSCAAAGTSYNGECSH